MGENNNFSIYSIDVPTNQDITLSFSPIDGTQNYTYTIYKDSSPVTTQQISGANVTEINLTETGTYKIVVNMQDVNGTVTTVESGDYIIDKEAPVINIDDTYIEVVKGKEIEEINISAYDNYDNDITDKITSNITEINTDELGYQKLIYTVSDTAGNKTSETIDVNVVYNDYTLIIIQTFLIVCLLIITLIVFRFGKLLKLEKRIDEYALSPKKEHNLSLMDIFTKKYKKINKKIAEFLNKSVFAQKYAQKLDKYVAVTENNKSGMEILAFKVMTALLFVILAFISNIIQIKLMQVYEIGLPLLIGFFIPDVLYFIKYRTYKKTIENDLLSAIIIMNNAFKAGRNITQAIDIVGEELNGVIAEEFKKMSLELSYGLDIEVIFKRFADRVKLEEVSYLTASLTVLNKTGGNIIEVFSSIEKTLFNKKTLRLELASLTGSSRIIVYILLSIPFVFLLAISVISPTYFLPFVTTDLGIILLVFMILYYILFVFVVRKIMKVVI